MTPVEGSTLTTVAVVMVVYLGVLIFIGWRAAQRTHGGEDFHLAGRSLGAWSAGISSRGCGTRPAASSDILSTSTSSRPACGQSPRPRAR